MIQPFPRVQPFVSYPTSNTYWSINGGMNDGGASDTYGVNIARIPLPWAITAQNLVVYSRDPAVLDDNTVTLRKNNVDTALAVTLPFGSIGPVANITDTVSYAALDDWSYHMFTGLGGSHLLGLNIEADNAGNVFGLFGVPGSNSVGFGAIGGALGNGFFQGYDSGFPTTRSNSYSICATPGNLTKLAIKTYGTSYSGGSWVAFIVLNGVIQDGSGGTVDTRTTLTDGTASVLGSFTLPLIVGDHVDVAYVRVGTCAAFELVNLSVGIGFVPTTDGIFMFTGGSNNVVGTDTRYVWVRNYQEEAVESMTLAPISPSGLEARDMLIERGEPGTGESFINTLRHNEGPTALSVTLVDLQTSGLITGQFEAYVYGDTIDLQSIASAAAGASSRLHWGIAATVTGSGPPPEPFGTLIVTKDAGGDLATPFTVEVGGGLSPASPALVGGDSQVYADVPAGSGYSVAEPVVPDGWQLTGITVSNGSDPANISIGDGETVTVTVANAQVIAPCVGDLEGARVDGLPYRPVGAVPTGALTINGEVITINGIPITVS